VTEDRSNTDPRSSHDAQAPRQAAPVGAPPGYGCGHSGPSFRPSYPLPWYSSCVPVTVPPPKQPQPKRQRRQRQRLQRQRQQPVPGRLRDRFQPGYRGPESASLPPPRAHYIWKTPALRNGCIDLRRSVGRLHGVCNCCVHRPRTSRSLPRCTSCRLHARRTYPCFRPPTWCSLAPRSACHPHERRTAVLMEFDSRRICCTPHYRNASHHREPCILLNYFPERSCCSLPQCTACRRRVRCNY